MIDKIYEYVKKINPTITKEELIKKIKENKLSTIALITIVK